MAVLIASDLAKDMVGEPLWRGVSLKLERRDRLTIAGRNGAGKTTLLRVLAGETSHDGGELVLAKNTRVALHDQRPPRERDLTLRDYVLSGAREPLELEAELGRLEQAMASGDDKAMARYADVYARFETVGGYGWRDQAGVTVHGLGFTDDDLDRKLETFSGGQLTRASLARALASKPDLLLLDEPTNHLDIESLEWLEQTLVGLDAAIVLIAHDRWFLEAVGTAVLELEAGRARFFKGTWHQWRREQAARELALGRAIEKQQAEIARMESFIERFRAKATKARQAQSRVKQLSKIERITRDPRDGRELGIAFKTPERSGRVIFELEHGHLEVPGRVLIDDADLWLERGEHVTLVGPNGTGKTTLINALAGRRPLDGGRLKSGHNVKVGYLSQHGEELEFGGARTVLEACQHHTKQPPNQARALLGRFLFSGDEAEKPLEGLSGGERKRLGLAILVASGANVLILDEPTNHLDLESREALEDALQAFPGALLLVSHDRALLEAIGTRTIAVEDYNLRSYLGGWQEYWAAREERKASGHVPPPPPAPRGMADPSGRLPGEERTADGMAVQRSGARDGGGAEGEARNGSTATAARPRNGARPAGRGAKAAGGGGGGGNGAAGRGASKNRAREQARLEKAVEDAEATLAALEDELADPSHWATQYASAKATARHTAAKRAVDEAYAALEAFEAGAPV
jgi:ATP-binding cassette subfamily F protein 3